MLDDIGIHAIEELPGIRSLILTHLADLDIEGTYPNVEDCLNISKETTYRELSRIRGLHEKMQRETGINLTGGTVNAVEICNNVFQLPLPDEMLARFMETKKISA